MSLIPIYIYYFGKFRKKRRVVIKLDFYSFKRIYISFILKQFIRVKEDICMIVRITTRGVVIYAF